MQLSTPYLGALDALGFVTEGLMGSTSTPDPPFTAPSIPLLSGGTLLPNRRDGVWLLDFDIGGKRHRFATREVSVPSRDLASDVVFVAGLGDLTPTLDADSLSVPITSAVDWGAERDALGPITGNAFVLRYWYAGQVLEDAYIALQGDIAGSHFAATDAPDHIALDLRRSELALSAEVVTTRETISSLTWGGNAYDTALNGIGYPIVIGFPGSGTYAGSPAMYVDSVTHFLLISVGDIGATSVKLFDQSTGAFDTANISYVNDGLNNRVAMADLASTALTVDPRHAYYASFQPTSGGGVTDSGHTVTGLGDLLIWGSKKFSRALFDLGEMESRRAALNLYSIDTVINQVGTLWEDWVQQNLVDLFSLEVVHGPHGIYYRQVRYDASERDVVAQLTTGSGHGGIRVARSADLTETTEDIYNQITVQYAPVGMDTSAYALSLVVGPTRDAATDQIPDPLCALSADVYGLRPRTLGIPVTFNRPTAYRLARDAVARYALPKLVTTYQGSSELFRLRKGSTVRVYDTVGGARFDGSLAIVNGFGFGPADTALVTLLFPN